MVSPYQADRSLADTVLLDGPVGLVLASPAATPLGYLPGTINYVPNPSVETNANSITAAGAATLTRVNTEHWDGNWSMQVDTPGSAAGEGLWWLAPSLNFYLGGATFVGSIALLGNNSPDGVVLRVDYTDGTWTDSPVVVPTVSTTTWKRFETAPVKSDPNRTMLRASVRVVTTSARAIRFWADGCQIEQGNQATPFAQGDYGEPYHRWTGVAHASLTHRDPIPLQTAIGHGGSATIQAKLWRANANNEFIEDISTRLISGKVSMSVDRDVKWSFAVTLEGAGWERLTPFTDYLAPVLTVTYPDGTVASGQLGLYVVAPSPETHTASGYRVDITAADPTWLLSIQGFKEPYTIEENVNIMTQVRNILAQAGVARYSIPASGRTTTVDTTWDTTKSKLAICNELLEAGGFYSLYADNTGLLTSGPYQNIRKTKAARTVAADGTGAHQTVIGAVKLDPETDKFRNRFVVVMDNPKRAVVKSVVNITHPLNPMGQWNIGVRTRKLRRRFLAGAGAVQELAQKLAREYSTLYERVTLAILPDPTRDVHEVLALAVYADDGEPVAVGKYWLRQFSIGFTPSTAKMDMTLGKTQETEGLST
jgi:hypothetical protein